MIVDFVFLALGAIALIVAAASCRAGAKADREMEKLVKNGKNGKNEKR